MSFEDRLRQAVERGNKRGEVRAHEAQRQALTEEECKRLHSQMRLRLSDQIESCVKRLPNVFPGFQYETIYGDKGWGGACFRDDLRIVGGQRTSNYSRLEMTIRPYSPSLQVIEVAGKATIQNKEAFNRTYYEKLEEVDEAKFRDLIDAWVLEYAEMFAAKK